MDIKKLFLPNLFKDSRDNMIYYNQFSDVCYRIPKSVESLVKLFLSRSLYSAILFLFLYDQGVNPLINILATIGLFGASTLYFNYGLLPKYHIAKNFNIDQAIANLAQEGRTLRKALTFAYLIAIVLIIYLAFTEQNTIFVIAGAIFGIYALYKVIQNILLLRM